ncbi:XRE family transcriptional regulator [Bacillus sp. V3-13]|uniref:helix-turn-helix domain-containing protein n=1 Tax=Bacillus sp. V3-13 TaxID=2053728 RepID=UPI000C771929|nr:helix-turn-helix domain-containing protein [Bacillus sp. V3-13]PLR77946.1 XRE family transcriptional regulator [Bacillus sp. V3-13]
MKYIGQRIKELRKANLLTQQELADGIVTRGYISQIEKYSIRPSYDILEKLAKRLNCKVEDFFEEPTNEDLILVNWKKDIHNAEEKVESGKIEQAEKIIDKLTYDKTTEDEDNYDYGLLLWIKGTISDKKRNWKEAEDYFKRSIKIFSNGDHVKEHIRSLDSLANVYLKLEQTRTALNMLNEAYNLLLSHQIGGLLKISLLVSLGITHGKLGEYHSSIRILKEALQINQATHTNFKSGHIFMTLGICHRRLQEWKDSEKSYQLALKFFDIFEDISNKAGTYTNLGVLYRYLNEYDKSIEHLLNAVDLFKKIDQIEKILNVKFELAYSLFLNNELEETVTYCKQILTENHTLSKGKALLLLGDVEAKRKNHSAALAHYKAAEILFKDSDSIDYLHKALSKIADIYYILEDYEKAAHYYNQIKLFHDEHY